MFKLYGLFHEIMIDNKRKKRNLKNASFLLHSYILEVVKSVHLFSIVVISNKNRLFNINSYRSVTISLSCLAIVKPHERDGTLYLLWF